MHRRRLIAAALAASLGIGVPATAAERCATPKEEAALRTRAVQTDLMMAALSCGERERYNSFVAMFRQSLGREGGNFKSYFQSRYGARATTQLNSYVTQLANLASQRYSREPGEFCAVTKNQLSELLTLKTAEFAAFIARQPIEPLPNVTFCTAQSAKP